MSCQVELIADCGDISSIGRALFIPDKEDSNWLPDCAISLSSCSNLLAVGYKSRLCLLTNQWISSTDSNTFLISWSGTLPADITVLLALPICPSKQSSQDGPDWFCVIVGFKNGHVGFYTNTGDLLWLERFDDNPVLKISCHTGTYGILPDDVHILFSNCMCIISGSSLYPVLRNIKAQVAKVRAGMHDVFSVDSRSISIRKWIFTQQEEINDAAVVGIDVKNTYDHLLSESTYRGYEAWYRSVPPVKTLILGAGAKPYIGFHHAIEGGNAPPLQDVARAVANKIKSALPVWLRGGSTENTNAASDPIIRSEELVMRTGLNDGQRYGNSVAISPDRRLAAIVDNFGRVAVLDITRGYLIRLFKGYREAQCAFVQIYEVDDKKPQLSIVKELKRAIFLIIYNPRKGLIDIRLMQRGNRVAAFTATKNGLLLYNTCGMVGAEKKYSFRKINLPEFECVLMDPDGKLKKFTIPFFQALEGEESQRAKDVHTLRELREYLKKTNESPDADNEILKKAAELNTVVLKKHCLELLIRKYAVSPKLIMCCLDLFWDGIENIEGDPQILKIKLYFVKLGLTTLFFRHIRSEFTEEMQNIKEKLHTFIKLYTHTVEEVEEDEIEDTEENSNSLAENVDNAVVETDTSEKKQIDENTSALPFELLENDSCILERLLTLAQDNSYKEHHHARVTFADNDSNNYKEFLASFKIDKDYCITLEENIPSDKINNLASIIFNSIFKMEDVSQITTIVKECKMDSKEIVKLLIMHLMNMPLPEIDIKLIEMFIKVLYNLCRDTKEATCIVYNDLSPWWQDIRDVIVEMPCPLRSMIVAMACKAVVKIFESQRHGNEDDIWESVTSENAKWGMLIGRLEEISILSIILMFNEPFIGDGLLKLVITEWNINLKYIYTKGKGAVTELIAKWLCGMGVTPMAIIVNELIEKYTIIGFDKMNDDSDDTDYIVIENNRVLVDENPKIFKWLSLLRQQFPLSTSADYIIANMSWEYAMAWQKSMQTCEYLEITLLCLGKVSDLHIRLGLCSMIWSTYIKSIFEVCCRLVNKVGRLPKDPLCLQDAGFDSSTLKMFFKITTEFLAHFEYCSSESVNQSKPDLNFEQMWDECTPSLVSLAHDTKKVNKDILNLNHQMSCTVYYMCYFNVKMSKPLDCLYDIDYHYVLEALGGNVVSRELNMIPSDKLREPRMKYITKLVRAAVDTITTNEGDGPSVTYNAQEFYLWMFKIKDLSTQWRIEAEYVNRQQLIALYHRGFDTIAINIIGSIDEPDAALPAIIAITTQRFKRSLEHTTNQLEWVASLHTHLYNHIKSVALDHVIPAHPSLTTTRTVLQRLVYQMEDKEKINHTNSYNMMLAKSFIETCGVLVSRKL